MTVSNPTGTITGTVSAEGTGLSGISVTLVNATFSSTTTGPDGVYTFTTVEAGNYEVSIDASAHPDVSIATTSKTASITSQGQTVTVDFSGSFIRTASIAGVVSADGAPLAGVSVVVTGGPDNVTVNSVTNAGGEYSAVGLRAGTYTVTISDIPEGFTFTTTTQSVTVATGESKAAHFMGTSSTLGLGFGPEQFALIPAGTFQMGDMVGDGTSLELPVHTVTLTKDFYMQKTQVTQGQWREVMGTEPSHFSDCGDLCPVDRVSWHDVQDFLAALNEMDPGKNYRMPTEAEWEYAARAGTTGNFGGTGVLDDMGWYSSNSLNRTHPVAQKQPNHWGLYDMHGSVWEWVRDLYGPYTADAKTDPTGPLTGSNRMSRGGSWHEHAIGARSSNRRPRWPDRRYYNRQGDLGFRLARTP